jgi:preprotein translocase subunit SecG
MYVVLTVLLILVSVFILLIVLVQNPKGGGAMGSAFGGAASNIIGVQKAGDVLERSTWVAAIVLLVLALGTTFFLPKTGTVTKTSVEQAAPLTPVTAPTTAPAMPMLPQEQPAEDGGQE